jgi:Helicase HerA, central domain
MNLDTESKLNLQPADFLSKRVAVLGTTGSGKTNTNAVLLEELLPHLPFAIIDPHGEYYTLREKYDVLIVGQSDNVDFPITSDQAAEMALWSYRERKSIILDLYRVVDDEERLEYVFNFCNAIWEHSRATALGGHQPYGVLLDEAHNFIPESQSKNPTLKKLKTFAFEGRKFGFSVFASTQRIAKLSKDFLAMCEIRFFHMVSDYPDVEAYAHRLTYKPTETKKIVMALKAGEAIFRTSGDQQVVHIRKRHTRHVEPNLQLDEQSPLQLRPIDQGVIAALKEKLGTPAPVVVIDPAEQQELIARLENDVAHWKQIANDFELQISGLGRELKNTVGQLEIAERRLREKPKRTAMVQAELFQGQQQTVVEETVTTTTRRIEHRSSLVTKKLVKRQTDKFAAFLQQLAAGSDLQRSVLLLLAEHADQRFTTQQIAIRLDCMDETAYRRCLTFFNLGLLVRHAPRVYQSNVNHYVTEHYPDLDSSALIDRLFGALIGV